MLVLNLTHVSKRDQWCEITGMIFYWYPNISEKNITIAGTWCLNWRNDLNVDLDMIICKQCIFVSYAYVWRCFVLFYDIIFCSWLVYTQYTFIHILYVQGCFQWPRSAAWQPRSIWVNWSLPKHNKSSKAQITRACYSCDSLYYNMRTECTDVIFLIFLRSFIFKEIEC